ncbi:MAG: hypothetical protein A2074_01090 [Candidatus Aquicultor primus]|uniref:Type 4 fimbrial biogenesis protein PilX N-terminal domain-containing protein n=1 Tax=Candidatus Aquicultor primus TaxID=1797195 RepID=A0A1F2UVM4_9ACTN|nr:MAG: hypothetical protein A2074_01090 [Candidatus Aquicultor primus]
MLKRLFEDERGIALLTVVGVMLIVTILSFGVITIAKSDLVLSERDEEYTEALHVAEAGIQKALWQLEQLGSTMEPKTFTINVGDGLAEVNAVQDVGSQWYWTIESTGTSGQMKRKLKVSVFNFSLWNMNMGLGEANSMASGGNGILGTTSIDGPFYVRGNVELSGSSEITGGPFFIKTGTLRFMNNSSTLGKSAEPIAAYIEPADGNEDILDKHGNPLEPGHPQVNVSQLSNQVPDIKIPPLDSLTAYRTRAASESEETCTAYPGIIATQSGDSGYKVLDNDINLESGTLNSRPMYYINSTINDFGVPGGEFAWDNINKRLYINGTIFVDGNLTIGDSANTEISYYGRGTIVVNGEIFVNGKLRPPFHDGSYNMDGAHVLGLVTAETIYVDISGSNSNPTRDVPDITGAFFATKKVKISTNNTSFVGSMLSGMLDFADGTNNSHLYTHEALPSFLPPSLPGSEGFLTMTASWREVQ